MSHLSLCSKSCRHRLENTVITGTMLSDLAYQSWNWHFVDYLISVNQITHHVFSLLVSCLLSYHYLIVLFHKSQCALRYLHLMSKIQNTCSQRSLATWLTVAVNEQNGDWPAPVSRVSVQPVIGWLKYEVARQWPHIVHRPRPHGNVTLQMRS